MEDFDDYSIQIDEDIILQDYDEADEYAKQQEVVDNDNCDIDFGG